MALPPSIVKLNDKSATEDEKWPWTFLNANEDEFTVDPVDGDGEDGNLDSTRTLMMLMQMTSPSSLASSWGVGHFGEGCLSLFAFGQGWLQY